MENSIKNNDFPVKIIEPPSLDEINSLKDRDSILNELGIESTGVKSISKSDLGGSSVENFDTFQKLSLQNWKNIYNISSRLVDFYDDIVILECLIDSEDKIFEEKPFKKSLFEGFELEKGKFFYLRYFERKNESRFEIHNDPTFINEKDFPKANFSTQFVNSSLFSKKK